MSKIKFLIISESLAQGGNERWIYEICRAIDKEKFEVGVLCSEKYADGTHEQNFSNFYYYELKKLGVPIYEYLPVYNQPPLWKRGIAKAHRIFQDFFDFPANDIPRVTEILQQQNVVCVLDFYNYATVKRIVHRACGERFFILLHSEKFQFKIDPYRVFDKNKSYKFAHFMPKQIKELAESGLDTETKNSFFYAPLVLNLSDFPCLFKPVEQPPIIFSIFSRIALTRPIDRYIEAFAGIQNQSDKPCRLNIYGKIIDSEQHRHLCRLIEKLNIENDSVKFMGHAPDIARAVKDDKVNIYWGSCSGGVLGYASIEIVAMGVATIFFDIAVEVDADDLPSDSDNDLLIYTHTKDFIKANLKYLTDNDKLAELSKNQRDYIIGKHHIGNFIGDFENYLVSIKSHAKK